MNVELRLSISNNFLIGLFSILFGNAIENHKLKFIKNPQGPLLVG